MKKILVLSAMEEEMAVLKDKLHLQPDEDKSAWPWPIFKSDDGRIIAGITGIGKVNAAACCSSLMTAYNIDMCIGIGVAGGIAPDLHIGDVLVSQDALQYDMDATAFGYEKGEVPRMGTRAFEADAELIKQVQGALQTLKLPVTMRQGRLLSGDCFVASEQGQSLYQIFAGDSVDMESAAWAQVAYLHHKPWLIIRSISDQANGQAHVDFNTFLPQAVATMSQLVLQIINQL